MKVRENYQPYLDRVKIYFDQLLPQVVDLQFTRGGSIIAAQVRIFFRPRNKSTDRTTDILAFYID